MTTDKVPSLAQTIGMLALSRGGRGDRVLAPRTRIELLRAQWIAPSSLALTCSGEQALASSPHRQQAARMLGRGMGRAASLTSTSGLTSGLTFGSMQASPVSRARNRRLAKVARAAERLSLAKSGRAKGIMASSGKGVMNR